MRGGALRPLFSPPTAWQSLSPELVLSQTEGANRARSIPDLPNIKTGALWGVPSYDFKENKNSFDETNKNTLMQTARSLPREESVLFFLLVIRGVSLQGC